MKLNLNLVFLTTGFVGLSTQQNDFSTYTLSTSIEPYSGEIVHANGNGFWIGKPTLAKVDPDGDVRTEGVRTTFTSPNETTKEFRLASYQPFYGALGRSQQVYVAPNGALKYLNPGQKPPAGSITNQFEFGLYNDLQVRDPKNTSTSLSAQLCPPGGGKPVQLFYLPYTKNPKCKPAPMLAKFAYGAYQYV